MKMKIFPKGGWVSLKIAFQGPFDYITKMERVSKKKKIMHPTPTPPPPPT